MTADVDWQSAFSPDVPYYNLSEEPVTAYTEPNGTEVAGTVAPGSGGFIETCNQTLDWCLIPLGGEGQSGWVDMEAFGGVAN
jgi:SH3-like domain-containing protein